MEQLEKKKDTNEYIHLFLDNSSERTTDLLTTANVRRNIDKQSFHPFILFTKKSNPSSRIYFISHPGY